MSLTVGIRKSSIAANVYGIESVYISDRGARHVDSLADETGTNSSIYFTAHSSGSGSSGWTRIWFDNALTHSDGPLPVEALEPNVRNRPIKNNCLAISAILSTLVELAMDLRCLATSSMILMYNRWTYIFIYVSKMIGLSCFCFCFVDCSLPCTKLEYDRYNWVQ